MLFALGAASSVLDALQSLAATKSSSSQSATSTQNTTNPFDVPDSSGTTAGSSSTTTGAPGWSRIAPETMNALLTAQSQSDSATTTTSTTSTTSPSDALQDLFSQIDANGDGQISKSEFENALGAGGTNVAQADDVFGKLDKDGDGSVSLDEMKQALQGAGAHHGGHHHHAQATGSSDQTSADGTSTDSTSSTDPLQQLLNAQAASTSQSGTNLASPYNFIDQLLQQQSQNFASASSTVLSV
jgi:Ca2+-binding EF-hand superfamily protein